MHLKTIVTTKLTISDKKNIQYHIEIEAKTDKT